MQFFDTSFSVAITMLSQKHKLINSTLWLSWVMPVTHSQESCTRNLHKFLVQETCIKFWCAFLVARFLYKKLTNRKKTTADNANNKTSNRQQSTNKQTNHISQFWSCVCKSLVSNRVLFYLLQDSCTRENLHNKAWHTVKFLVQLDLHRFLVQDSWLWVTGIRQFGSYAKFSNFTK